jgi:nucleoside-diphosphate-sugar epimerase
VLRINSPVPGRVLITGASGFTGPYLRAALESRGHQVVGVADHARNGLDTTVDLLDAAALDRFLENEPFDYVVHLAALSTVVHDNAADYYRVNLLGALNLLEALARAKLPLKKIILASSANIYGRPARIPVDESAVPAPLNHYGVSKYAMELMARLWFDQLPILITRPFNYSGVGQSPKFVFAKIVGHFRDRAPQIELGNTSVVRELMDVRDVAAIYARLLESKETSEAVNLCAGRGYRVDDVLEKLCTLTGVRLRINRAPALVRGNEIPELVGSPAKLSRLIGEPTFRPLEETLRWMVGT